MLTRLKQGVVTFGRYAFASVLSTCQYVSSAGNLLVNLEGKLVNFAGSKNAIVNEVITGVSTVASLLVTSFTRVPANFRLILAKPKNDDADPAANQPPKKAASWSSLHWKGRIFYLFNAPLSVLSCFFGPLNIYYFSHTVIMGLIYLLRKVMPAPFGQPDDEDQIMHMGSVITISVFILLARAINTVAYDLKIANANALEIASTLDKGELPTNWSTLLATTLITLPSAVSVTLLAHNSTLKSLEHIEAQLPFRIPHVVLNAVTKFSTVSATQGHILKSAPSIYGIILRTLMRLEGNPPQETTTVNCSLMLKSLFYATSIITCVTDGFTGSASVAGLFENPRSALALVAAIVSGASLSACAFGLNRQGFFRTMNYQPVQTLDDLEANQGLLANDDWDWDAGAPRRASASDLFQPPRATQSIAIASTSMLDEEDDDDIDNSLFVNASPMTPVSRNRATLSSTF